MECEGWKSEGLDGGVHAYKKVKNYISIDYKLIKSKQSFVNTQYDKGAYKVPKSFVLSTFHLQPPNI